MTIIPLSEVKSKLNGYIDQVQETGPIVITRNGKAVAVLLAPESDADLELILMQHSKKLKTILEESRKSFAKGTQLSHKDVWAHLEQ
jgi:prevent-host-death family protein